MLLFNINRDSFSLSRIELTCAVFSTCVVLYQTFDLTGRNLYCIDKNYGGVLIVWDRLFGKELTMLCVGIRFPGHDLNPAQLRGSIPFSRHFRMFIDGHIVVNHLFLFHGVS